MTKPTIRLFDIFYDEHKTTGADSYWIVFEDNDGSIQAGRLGPFNTHLESLSQLEKMKFVGNYKEDNSLIDLWKSNPPVMGDV